MLLKGRDLAAPLNTAQTTNSIMSRSLIVCAEHKIVIHT